MLPEHALQRGLILRVSDRDEAVDAHAAVHQQRRVRPGGHLGIDDALDAVLDGLDLRFRGGPHLAADEMLELIRVDRKDGVGLLEVDAERETAAVEHLLVRVALHEHVFEQLFADLSAPYRRAHAPSEAR